MGSTKIIRTRFLSAAVVAFASAWTLPACGDGDDEGEVAATATDGEVDGGSDDADDGVEAARPNWHEDVAPLVASHCIACHSGDSIAFSMEGYAATRPYAEIMVSRTELRQMPPWHARETDECQPEHSFEHDARLTDDQIALFADWAALGAPEGDPALAAPVPEPPSSELSGVTATATMAASLTIEQRGGKLDFFHCLSLDPGNAEDVFVDAMQVLPGNAKVAHHVLVYIDADAESAGWTDGVLEDCDGGAGTGNATLVGGWIPGALPMETPDNVGIALPAGARIVLNVHYHVDVAQPQIDDATGLALRWSTAVPPWVSQVQLMGEPGLGQRTSGDFLIPAGATGHVETLEWTAPPGTPPLRVWAIANHMHKVGVDMKTSVIKSGAEHCILQTPEWDFNWQRVYELDAPIEESILIEPGDTLRLRCTYDNTLDNRGVVDALAEVGLGEPQDVRVGEGTLDEMCIAGVAYAVQQ